MTTKQKETTRSSNKTKCTWNRDQHKKRFYLLNISEWYWYHLVGLTELYQVKTWVQPVPTQFEITPIKWRHYTNIMSLHINNKITKQHGTAVISGNDSHRINLQHKIPQILVMLLGNGAWIQQLVLLLQALLEKHTINNRNYPSPLNSFLFFQFNSAR